MRGGMRLHSPDLYMAGEVGFPFRQLDRIYTQLIEEDNGLMFEAEPLDIMDSAYNPGDVIDDSMILDAVSTRYNRFPRTMAALQRVFNRQLPDSIEAMEPETGKPRKAGGFSTVTAQFPFSDGQRVTIIFHAPGSGSTIRGTDEVVAFRWLLNKRDITHIVAPEMSQGIMRDIPLQQLARRISQLVEKNSARFRAKQEKVNKARTALMETELVVEQLNRQIDSLQLELQHMGDDSPEKSEKISQLQTELDSWNKRNAALSGLLTPRSNKTRTIRAHDMELETTMEVISVDELITSDDERFDQRLQPRDRTREASKEQIRNMVRTLDPYQLMDAPTADTGAPVVGPDGLVESGNGRTMALRQVVKDPLLHRRYAQAVEKQTGIKVREGEVLIRRRTTPMDLEQRIEFTKAANQQNIAKMSSTEQGLSDARMIDDGMLSEFKGGDLTSVANTGFVSAFIGKLPVNERNDLIGAHGHLSQTGVVRIRNALLGAAYESADVMARVTESTDDNVKSISNALVDAAPAIARLKRDVEAGRVEPEFDISKQVAEAAGKVSQARANRQAISEVLNQDDMFGERDLITEELIKAFYNHDMTRALGRDKIAQSLIHYAIQARNETTDGNLFGASITPAQLLADANKRRDEGSTSQNSIFDSLSRVFMHPLFDGMVIKDEGPAMPLTGLELDAAMVSLYARDGYALMTEAHSLQIMDAAYNPGEEIEGMVLDAVSGDASKLPRVIGVLARSMDKKLTGDLSVEGHAVGKPKVSGGFATVTAQLKMSDGQTVSIIFHAPDNDPKKIAPSDQVIAFRFLMNSRDITHVVAPEMVKQGIMRDIPLATVTTRISQLVQKNSDKFTKQQEKNSTLKADLAKAEAEVLALTEKSVTLSDEVAELEQVAPLEQELARIEAENDDLRKQIAERKEQAGSNGSTRLDKIRVLMEEFHKNNPSLKNKDGMTQFAEYYFRGEGVSKNPYWDDHDGIYSDIQQLYGLPEGATDQIGAALEDFFSKARPKVDLDRPEYLEAKALYDSWMVRLKAQFGNAEPQEYLQTAEELLAVDGEIREKLNSLTGVEIAAIRGNSNPVDDSMVSVAASGCMSELYRFVTPPMSGLSQAEKQTFLRAAGLPAKVTALKEWVAGIEVKEVEDDSGAMPFIEQESIKGRLAKLDDPKSKLTPADRKLFAKVFKVSQTRKDEKVAETAARLRAVRALHNLLKGKTEEDLAAEKHSKEQLVEMMRLAGLIGLKVKGTSRSYAKLRGALIKWAGRVSQGIFAGDQKRGALEGIKEQAKRGEPISLNHLKTLGEAVKGMKNADVYTPGDQMLARALEHSHVYPAGPERAENELFEKMEKLFDNAVEFFKPYADEVKPHVVSILDTVESITNYDMLPTLTKDQTTAMLVAAGFPEKVAEKLSFAGAFWEAVSLDELREIIGEGEEPEGPSPEITEAVETLKKAAAGDFQTFAATMDAAEKAINTLEAAGVADQHEDLISQVTDKAFEMDTAENGA